MADIPVVPAIPEIPEIRPIDPIAPVSSIGNIAPGPTATKARPKPARIEVGSYWINTYRRSECRQTNVDHCGDIANGFAQAMQSHGHKWSVTAAEEFATPLHWNAWHDRDPNGIDTIEFAFLATHGGTHGKELPQEKPGESNWLYWVLFTFDSKDFCFWATISLVYDAKFKDWAPPDAKNPQPVMRLGNGRLRWLALDFCRSLHVGLVNERQQAAKAELAEATPFKAWARCFDGVNMLFGFTGLSSDASWTSDRGKSFGHRVGRGETMAESWLDEALSYFCHDAPVVMACGRSGKEAEDRLKTESLKAIGPRLRAPDIGGYAWWWRAY